MADETGERENNLDPRNRPPFLVRYFKLVRRRLTPGFEDQRLCLILPGAIAQ
jgi:hypothetical protein